MRVRFGMLVLSLILISAGLHGGYDPAVGTWKLNLERSKFSPGYPVPKSQTCQIEASGDDGLKFTADTVEANGKTTHAEYTAKLDGADYPVKGDPNRDAVALKRNKPFLTDGVSKKAGTATGTFTIMIWANGLRMTITSKETRDGKTLENIAVYTKIVQ